MSELTIQSKTNKKAGTFERLALAKSLMQDGLRGSDSLEGRRIWSGSSLPPSKEMGYYSARIWISEPEA